MGFYRDLTLKPQGATIVVAGFLPVFAIVTMFPIVATMIQHFAADPQAKARIPEMVTAPGIAVALLAPFAGFFVDRFGRRQLLLWCTFFYGIFGVAPFFLDNISQMFGARVLLGVCEAGILTTVNTLIGDYWDDRGRRNWLFLQSLVGPLVSIGVIFLGGQIAAWRWNACFLVYLMAFPIFWAILATLYEPKPPEPAQAASPTQAPPKSPFPVASMAGVGAMTLFTSVLYYVFIVNGSLAWQEIGVKDASEVGRLTAIPSLFILVGAAIFRLIAFRSNTLQIGAFLAFLGGGLAVIGLAKTIPLMSLGLMLQQTGAGMAIVILIAWAQTKFPYEHRGRGMGIWTAAFFFGQFVSPWIVHELDVATGTIQGAFLATGLTGLAAAIVAFAMLAVQPARSTPPLNAA